MAGLPELADIKKRQGKKPEEARASTTDAADRRPTTDWWMEGFRHTSSRQGETLSNLTWMNTVLLANLVDRLHPRTASDLLSS